MRATGSGSVSPAGFAPLYPWTVAGAWFGRGGVVESAETGDPNGAAFGCGGQTLTTRLDSGEYPSIAKLIPTKLAATAVLETAGLAAAVKRLAVIAARDTPVRLAFTPGQLELATGSGDEASGSDTVACELDGGPAQIAFSPRLLLDALAATSETRVRVGLAGPDKPALFVPVSASADAHPHYLKRRDSCSCLVERPR